MKNLIFLENIYFDKCLPLQKKKLITVQYFSKKIFSFDTQNQNIF